MAFLMVVVVIAATILAMVVVLWLLPLSWWGANKDAIQAIVLPFAALGALIALAFTGWRSWAQHQQMQTDRRRQLTDSFSSAVQLLGHDNRSVRLGAIYALERIARQNPDEHWPIMETLAAHVRDRSERLKEEVAVTATERQSSTSQKKEPKEALIDIQAIVAVLGRRRTEHERSRQSYRSLNLNGSLLASASFRYGNFEVRISKELYLLKQTFCAPNCLVHTLKELTWQKPT